MSDEVRTSRGGFVVIKLLVDDEVCLLLRKNAKWKDVNLIGGHIKDRDQGNLEKTALRELWEEVPSIRNMSGLALAPLTQEVKYGPVFSRSVGLQTVYFVQYFLLRITGDPAFLLENLGARTRNVLVSQTSLIMNASHKVSGLVSFLDQLLPDGIRSISLSSSVNLRSAGRWSKRTLEQIELSLSNFTE
jgi:hypothetical protein